MNRDSLLLSYWKYAPYLSNKIILELIPDVMREIHIMGRLRYPLRRWSDTATARGSAWRGDRSLHWGWTALTPVDEVCAVGYGAPKLWKSIASHNELDSDLPFQFLGGPQQHVKLKAQLKVRGVQPFVEARLYTWEGGKDVEIGHWQITLEGTPRSYRLKKPGLGPRPSPGPPLQQVPIGVKTPAQTFHGQHNPMYEAVLKLQREAPPRGHRYTPEPATQRWLQGLAKQYGVAPSPQTFQARYDPLGKTVRGFQAWRTAISPTPPGATYTNIYTKRTYKVDTFGRHIQTGSFQVSATQTQYGARPTTQTFQTRYDPLGEAVRKLQPRPTAMAQRYTPQPATQRWLQGLAKQYGVGPTTQAFQARYNPMGEAVRRLRG